MTQGFASLLVIVAPASLPTPRSGAGVDLPGFGRRHSDMSDREEGSPAAAVLPAAVHAALLITMMKIVIVLGANLISHLTMLHLNAAVSSRMRTFPAIFIASSWSSASSFAGF